MTGLIVALLVGASTWPAMAQVGPSATPGPAPSALCELHVFPTRNFFVPEATGFGFAFAAIPGLSVAGAAMAAGVGASVHGSIAQSTEAAITDQFTDGLTPDDQIALLRQADVIARLSLQPDTYIVVEQPIPSDEDLRHDSALKQRARALQKADDSGSRSTPSMSRCYGELFVTQVDFRGSLKSPRLEVGWKYRDFKDRPDEVWHSTGEIQSELGGFPATSVSQIDAARQALQKSFHNNFVLFVNKKIK
jgi:hypothetical protein